MYVGQWQSLNYVRHFKIHNRFSPIGMSHWDFLPKFLSLHYYTTLEGVLGVQRRGQGQGTMICLLGLLFSSQNGMTFKTPTKIIKI